MERARSRRAKRVLGMLLMTALVAFILSGTALAGDNLTAYDPKGFQTDLFTGAAGAGVPIEVLPGTGGLQPGLGLSYSSLSVDDLGLLQQPGWTGLGGTWPA